MKTLLIIVAGFTVYMAWGSIRTLLSPPPDYGAMHEEQVVLYATDWCRYCQKARELMDEHGISYFEYDIEKSAEGREQYKRLGGRGVPVLLINGEVVKGFNSRKILSLTGES